MPSWTKEQEHAIYDEGSNIIVSAGAGSGKTAVLSERVLQKVLHQTKVNELLILTFTNAAAKEMKDRIRDKLVENNLTENLELLDSAYITTFDSFALSLVKKYYYLLNINKDLSIGDESIFTLLKSQILEDIFNDLYEENNLLFMNLINDFCTKDDKDFQNLLLKVDKSMELEPNKLEFLNNFITKYYDDTFLDNLVTKYNALLLKYISDITDLVGELSHYVSSKFYNSLDTVLNPLLNAHTYREIKNACVLELPRMENGSAEEAKNIKDKISKNITKLKTLTKYEDEKSIKESLIQTKNYALVIKDILIRLEEKVENYKQTKGIYDFTDIAKMAIKVLEENPRIRESLKHSFKEILIDEYQDTSDLQETFISLIENNNVYMVGDVKQSIYRFRNANPELFRQKYNKYAALDGGKKIDLTKNFRSRKEVIENINLIFSYLMDDEVGMAAYRLDHQMNYGNEDYLRNVVDNCDMDVLTYEKDDAPKYSEVEIEAFTIANSIKTYLQNGLEVMDKNTKTLRKARLSDFCILMDKGKNFETYKKIFEYLGLPTAIYRDTPINDSEDLLIIKNIFNLLVGIANKNYDKLFSYAFLSVGRSYLTDYDDEYLFDIITHKKYYETSLYQKLETILKDYETLSPVMIYDRIIATFDIYNQLIKVGDINKHTIVYDYLRDLFGTLEGIGYTLFEICDYLNNVTSKNLDLKFKTNKDDSDACKIMTIHTSKGLEFPICYFSGFSSEFNIKDLTDRIIYNKDFGLIIPYKNNGLKNTILKELNSYDYYQEEISEKIRLFYVALTRAREKMILVTPLKDSNSTISHGVVIARERLKYRSILDMVTSLKDILTPYLKRINLDEIGLTKNYKFKAEKQNLQEEGNIIKVEDNPLEEALILNPRHYSKDINDIYSEEDLQNINFGLLCHKELENIDFNNPNYDHMNELVAKKIKSFINTGILNNALNIYQEYEFVYDDSKGIIDLLIEYDDHYTIVDYKLKNTQDDAYLKQVKGYKDYLKTITNKEIKTYLYSILDEELVPINV